MNRNIFAEYQNQYSLNKTLRNELIPCGRTLEYMEERGILTEDEERAENYKVVKQFIDAYHKNFISESLSNLEIPYLDEYYEVYIKVREENKTDIDKLSGQMRKHIVKHIKSNPKFHILFSKELITKELYEILNDNEKKVILEQFANFSTYFSNFHENRKNMYDDAEKSTAIAFRIINQNLPKFIDNMRVFDIFDNSPLAEKIEVLELELKQELNGKTIRECFQLSAYSKTITNEQITLYNTIIGGITIDDKKRVQGLNEYINLYNQKNKESIRIPKFNMLFKQILADRETFSFVTEQFQNDQEVMDAISEVVDTLRNTILKKSGEGSVFELLKNIENYDLSKIYVSNGVAITDISNALFKDWSCIKRAIEADYDKKKNKVKKGDKYYEKRNNEIKKKKCFSIDYLNTILEDCSCETKKIQEYFVQFACNDGSKLYDLFMQAYNDAEELLNSKYYSKNGLMGDKKTVQRLKQLLDSIKNIELFIKPLLLSGNESDIDYTFYGELDEIYQSLTIIIPLYNKVRNYVTRKPYSTEKIKLNFGNPEFLGGWHVNREIATYGLIFKDDNFFYLGVIAKGEGKNFKSYPEPEGENDRFYKMEYLQAADPKKDVQNLMVIDGKTEKKNGRKEKSGPHAGENLLLENLKDTYLPADINEIRKKKSYSRLSDNFCKEDLMKFIDFYKDRIMEYEGFKQFTFSFKESSDYLDFKEFTDDVNAQAYQLKFVEVSKKHIESLVEEGKLYLFKIYNKDFSEYSKGTPNLHTIYFKMLFDERNLANVVYKLNGQAEVFYRKKSIDLEKMVVHPKKQPIKNKNIDVIENKEYSVFEYDLIKDRRYTMDKFQLHLPITMNFHAEGSDKLNNFVLQTIRENEDIHVIGIDRGERNLIYISVINSKGEIIEQESMNIVKTDKAYKQDYHRLLEGKEKEREEARRNWDIVENIKELKEGYLSQVIYKVINLMIKYNAIVVLEDLNSGFVNSRKKIEKQVYQKFEKMLIDKLNYFVDKKKGVEELGGALHAYQLTNKFESFVKMGKQSGFLFYIPAWNTSKIDPTTGFVNLLHFKYSNIEHAREQVSKFRRISFNGEYFEFDINYGDYTQKSAGTKTEWTLCSYGTRIMSYRNSDNIWTQEEIDITDKIQQLFVKYKIDVTKKNLVEQILLLEKKEFYQEFFACINLVLQMRNSKTGTDIDYMVSPIKNAKGYFFDTREYDKNSSLPCDADANGAFNIARKGLLLMEQIRNDENEKKKITITNKEWLDYAQENVVL